MDGLRLGDLTPALSVEGGRARTDARRGPGTFDRVLAAMAALREAGVLFSLSVTVTRENCQEVLSDAFLDFFSDKQGALADEVFCRQTIAHGEQNAPVSQEIWEQAYL